jgi:uncharacterized protein YqhQ
MKPSEESLAFGGQALIEGVMMRSGSHMVMCVRQPDSSINTSTLTVKSRTRDPILGLPFIRGIVTLFETMYFGVKSVMHSANLALEEENEAFTITDYLILVVMLVAINGAFIAIPYVLTGLLGITGILFNVVESALRLTMFILYLYLISRWGEVARVLQYHGAEHKAINAHEAGAPLDTETVAGYPRLNPRCGTSFLFLTVVTSIALFAMIPQSTYWMRLAYRLVLIPVIASVSYELLKLSDKHRDSPVVKALMAPGLLFQRLTTKEPDPDMIEVAVKALEEVKSLTGSGN